MDFVRTLITCVPGIDSLLVDELKELGLAAESASPGAVALPPLSDADMAKVLVHSRLASSVLQSIKTFSAANADMLYDQVRRIAWNELFTDFDMTMAVTALGHPSESLALSFATLKIKDAVCDELKKLKGYRPDVDRKDPTVSIFAFFAGNKCELSIEVNPEPLHKRGYRAEGGEAPLRENRAAALLRLMGFTGDREFVDPFCGSGTISIEAAMIAQKVAPGTLKDPRQLAHLKLFPTLKPALEAAQATARAERLSKPLKPVRASDVESNALKIVGQNAERAHVSVETRRFDALHLKGENLDIACNPPYGERVLTPEKAKELLSNFTRQLKHNAPGSRLALVLPKGRLEHAIGFKPARKLEIASGNQPLKLLMFELYAGSKRQAD